MKSVPLSALALTFFIHPALAADAPRNAIIFIADGLRYDSVTPELAPTFDRIRKEGVDFTNSHSLFPTVTTANASAIATGHYLGDTGDYGNTLYVGYSVKARDNSPVVFVEDDAILADVKRHFGDGYLGQPSLVARARAQGFVTAVVGKIGPALIQDIGASAPNAIVVDDALGKTNYDGTPNAGIVNDELAKSIATVTGLEKAPSSATPNIVQQSYLTTAAARAVLPYLKAKGKPFVLVFWSRDPDATQHASPDKIGSLVPGVNGETPRSAIANADSNLKTLLDAVARLGLADSTDVFVTADHGFSTIAKGLPDAEGQMGPAAYPSGFLALDVARWLEQKVFDPDAGNAELDPTSGDHPSKGSGLIGPTPDAPIAAVAQNGGSDLIYALGPKAQQTAKRIFAQLAQQPYVGALFVNDALLKGHKKDFSGALPLSAINLIGAGKVPQPAILVGFRSFGAKGCNLAVLLCAATISDTSLQTGQGMHGSFNRADTRNFMAAMGPDFKRGYADEAPISNADIAPTLAHALGLPVSTGPGKLQGRAATEALEGGAPVKTVKSTITSDPTPDGLRTVLDLQQVGETRYFDAAGIPGRTVGLSAP
ncbi:MAG TPA: alkaline phosphatase family protein [Rhizomicrobium sp.]|jgi:arylsulfatase A-like enzyme